ncbi:MAG: response regulator [Anaerolineae bacterium]|nr:response regulator [Anaerolineae bacterium]MDH7475265.1 response regulator [Anaerolineae bacterium]
MSRQKILLVDDALFNRRLIEVVLKPQGYELLMAENGQEGIDLAIRERPDLILMDIQLPDIDGYMATKELKRRVETRAIPVIALTASTTPEDIQHATESGFAAYISKPFNPTDLPKVIADLLSRHAADTHYRRRPSI